MDEKDFVPYETAKKLKEAGFDWKCGSYIEKIPGTEREEWNDDECCLCTVTKINCYPKATLWQAQKWLRDKKNLSVEPYANIVGGFNCRITDLASFADEKSGCIGFPSYEAALSAGIDAALELITNKIE